MVTLPPGTVEKVRGRVNIFQTPAEQAVSSLRLVRVRRLSNAEYRQWVDNDRQFRSPVLGD